MQTQDQRAVSDLGYGDNDGKRTTYACNSFGPIVAKQAHAAGLLHRDDFAQPSTGARGVLCDNATCSTAGCSEYFSSWFSFEQRSVCEASWSQLSEHCTRHVPCCTARANLARRFRKHKFRRSITE